MNNKKFFLNYKIYTRKMSIYFIGDSIINKKDYVEFLSTHAVVKQIVIDSIFEIRKNFFIGYPIKFSENLINIDTDVEKIFLSLFINDMRDKFYDIDDSYLLEYEKIIILLKKRCDNIILIFPQKPYIGESSDELYLKDEIIFSYNKFYNFII